MRSGVSRSRSLLLLSFVTALTALGPVSAPAADNPAVTIEVDGSSNRHPISPDIYGVAWATNAALTDLDVTINRWGGNAMSRYNWIFSTANRAKDWYFENIPDSVAGDGSDGESADDFIGPSLAAGADVVITIPLMGLLPKDRAYRCGYSVIKYGAQTDADGDCGNGHSPPGPDSNANRMRFVNDPADTSATYTSTHQANWVQHMVTTWGAASAGGVRYYSYDNEPVLWSFDHWDIHPNGSTYDEIWSAWEDYGPKIKAVDGSALLLGPEEWGWSGYFDDGNDAENGNTDDRDAKGGVYLSEWLLQQAAAYEQGNDLRILDVFTLHFYPQNGEFSNDVSQAMQETRNRSTRALWDPDYVDESWIGGTGIDGGIVRLIPRMKQWVANNYPGTKIGLTEYNWGAENHINGGTAQADILGILGREGVDMAIRWTSPPDGSPVYNAFKLYRNYDANHSRFGDTSIGASGTDVDEIAPFAAIRSSDSALTLMIVTKSLSGNTPATVNLANFVPYRSASAQRWQLDSTNAITQLTSVNLSGLSLSLTLPPQTVTLLVIPGATAPGAPTIGAATPGNASASIAFTPPANDGGSDITSYTATCNPGAKTGSGAGSPVAVSGLTNGVTHTCSVTATNAAGTGVASGTVEVTPNGLTAPGSFSATATSSSQVALSWSPVNGATSYEIQRSVANSAFTPLASGIVSTAYNDTSLIANTTYLYKVRAVSGGGTSAFTPVDAATTTIFTDDPLVAGATIVKAAHVTQLRTAVNAIRGAAGLPAQVFSNPTPSAGVTITAAQITELRTALDQARAAIGLPAIVYTDPALVPGTTTIKAAHITSLRGGVK